MFDSRPALVEDVVFDGFEFGLKLPYSDALKERMKSSRARYYGAKDSKYSRYWRFPMWFIDSEESENFIVAAVASFGGARSETVSSFRRKILAAREKPVRDAFTAGLSATIYPLVNGDAVVLVPYHPGINAQLAAMGGSFVPSVKGWSLPNTSAAMIADALEHEFSIPPDRISIVDGDYKLENDQIAPSFAKGHLSLGDSKFVKPTPTGNKKEVLLARVPPRMLSDVTEKEILAAIDGYGLYDYQKDGVLHLGRNTSALLADDMGLGKAQPLDTPVLTPSGWRALRSLRVGDGIVGRDGRAHRVTGFFPQGEKPVFRLYFDDGATTRCCREHLWRYRLCSAEGVPGPWKVASLESLYEEWRSSADDVEIPLVDPVDHPFREALPTPVFAGREAARHPGAVGACAEWICASVDQRRSFLAGFIDAGGVIGPDAGIEVDCVVGPLADSIAAIARSLGGVASIDAAHRVRMALPSEAYEMPHSPKSLSWLSMRNAGLGAPRRVLTRLEECGVESCACLSVSADDRLYVTEGYIVTHNTRQAIVAADIVRRRQKVLVGCPSSLVLNWRKEIRSVDAAARISVRGFHEDADWIVSSYDQLPSLLPHVKRFRILITDEAQMLKEPDSLRTRFAFDAAAHIGHRYILSGTPIMNREGELHTLLRLGGHPLGALQVQDFVDKFGKNPKARADLHLELRNWMMRRMKESVLKHLKGKRRELIELIPQAPEIAEYRKVNGDPSISALQKVGILRRLLERMKLPFIGSMARRMVPGDKMIIFCEYNDSMELMCKMLASAGVGHVTLSGSDSKTARQRAVDRFQEDAGIRVFVGTTAAAGVGITLTAANMVAFASLPWTAALRNQAEDRAYRNGQMRLVNVIVPIIPGTIDSGIVQLLNFKEGLAEDVMAPDAEKVALSAKELEAEIAQRLARPGRTLLAA